MHALSEIRVHCINLYELHSLRLHSFQQISDLGNSLFHNIYSVTHPSDLDLLLYLL